MDAILQVAHAVSGYATLIAQNVAIGGVILLTLLVMAMVNSPDITMIVCLLTALAISWHLFKQLRRFLRWFIIWPINRMFYRLVRRPVRLLLGGIMARWKTGIVADRLDDTLSKLCYDEHILSKQEYRRLSNLIGKALGIGDLVTKKVHKEGIKHTVLENIGLMRLTTSVPGPPKTVVVDKTYKPNVVSLNYLRRRNPAA